ncbi:MAG: hypothetical protein VW714_01935 [Rhodospirillales bacterium]
MARKPSARKSAEEKLVDVALELAAAKPWARVGMEEIAKAANLPLEEAYSIAPCRATLVVKVIERFDRAMLRCDDTSLSEESHRDQLFDAVMRRLEAMQPHRKALKSITMGMAAELDALFYTGIRMMSSAKWMLRVSGISADGPLGFVRAKALLVVYAITLRTFIQDDSDDLATTMSVLDKNLKLAGRLFS